MIRTPEEKRRTYSKVAALGITETEAGIMAMVIEEVEPWCYMDSYTDDDLREIVEFIRKNVPADMRAGPMFGAN